MNETRIRTSLAPYQPVSRWNEDDLKSKAKRLYHESGTVMINPEWLTNDFDRQQLTNMANKLYGHREKLS